MSFDMAVYTLTCKNCGATEDSTIRDHVSVWSGCDWASSASFSRFDTKWAGGGKEEPDLVSVRCTNCGSSDVKFDTTYKPFG